MMEVMNGNPPRNNLRSDEGNVFSSGLGTMLDRGYLVSLECGILKNIT